MVRQQEILKSSASELPTSKVEILGVSNGRTSSRNIKLKLTYVPEGSSSAFPTNFRVANSQDDLASAPDQLFDQNDKVIDWTLSSGNGQKTVYAQFQVNNLYGTPVSDSVVLEGQLSLSQFQIGVETTGITDYGQNDLFPFSKSSDVGTDLSELQRMKGSIVRVFVGNYKITDAEAAKRLGEFLDKAAPLKISAIVTFINDTSDFGFYPSSAQSYYTDKSGSSLALDKQFFTDGYKSGFKSFVETVVRANKDRSNIYAWEIGNELKTDDPDTLINFLKDIAFDIKNIDPAHPIASGFGSSKQVGILPIVLYTQVPEIDIITVHALDGDHSGVDDVNYAIQNGKVAIVEDLGLSGSNRTDTLASEIVFWKNQGVSAILQRGFLGRGVADNGNGDKQYGMDTILHSDYDALFNVYQNAGNPPQVQFAQPTPVPPSPTPVQTPSPTSSPTPVISKYDLDGDGKVDNKDLILFQQLWVKGGYNKALDFNGDGVVNALDYDLLKKQISAGQ